MKNLRNLLCDSTAYKDSIWQTAINSHIEISKHKNVTCRTSNYTRSKIEVTEDYMNVWKFKKFLI